MSIESEPHRSGARARCAGGDPAVHPAAGAATRAYAPEAQPPPRQGAGSGPVPRDGRITDGSPRD